MFLQVVETGVFANELVQYGAIGLFLLASIVVNVVLWKRINESEAGCRRAVIEREKEVALIIKAKDDAIASLNQEARDFATQTIQAMTLATKAMENLDNTKSALVKEFSDLRRELNEKFLNICSYKK